MNLNKISGIIGAVISALFLCRGVEAAAGGQVVVDTYMSVPPVAAYSSTFSMRADGLGWASAQIVVTSVTQTSPVFNDGRASTGSFTVNDYTSLSTATASGQFTSVSTSVAQGVVASTSILISSNVAGTIIQITGPPIANLPQVMTIGGNIAQGFSSTNTAVNIAAFVSSITTSGLMTTSVSGSSVTFAFVSSGTFGNSYAITSSSQAAVSSATFVSGANPVSLTLGGATYIANTNFLVGTSSAAMMNNLATAINASSQTALVIATAPVACGLSSPCGVVYATATTPGTIGNGYALATSNALAISTSGVFMTGGHDNATICLNGTCLTANAVTSSFTAITSNNATATSIAGSFSASASSLTTNVQAIGAVVTATSTAIGSNTNYTLTSSTQGALTISPFTSSGPVTATGSMYGGSNSSYTLNGSVILSTGSTLGLAQGVWFSTLSATGISYSTAPGGTAVTLAFGTTVYAIPGSGSFQLSLTSTGAIAGLPIVLVSSTVKTTPDVFQLNVITGPANSAAQWVASNDNVHWVWYNATPFNVAVPSITYVSTGYNGSTGVANNFDLGHFDYAYIGVSVTASTAAPTNVLAHVVGKAP